jgi:hypothetical protein
MLYTIIYRFPIYYGSFVDVSLFERHEIASIAIPVPTTLDQIQQPLFRQFLMTLLYFPVSFQIKRMHVIPS